GGVNVIVLENLDDDANPLTPFSAGNAADLIADHITTPGAGFFIYFNQGLDIPRLVYSTDLSDHNADLSSLARLINLNGQLGINAMFTFTAANFQVTAASAPAPEPSGLFLIASGLVLVACGVVGRGKRRQA